MAFEALVAANDIMAVDALQALKERGIRVPGDVALAGFDNREIAQAIQPPLTTVELPTDKEVRLAADVIQRLLRGEDVPLRTDIETEVVLSQSCGCASVALQQLTPRDHRRLAESLPPEVFPLESEADPVLAWPSCARHKPARRAGRDGGQCAGRCAGKISPRWRPSGTRSPRTSSPAAMRT